MQKPLVQLAVVAALVAFAPGTASAACPELDPAAGPSNTEGLSGCTDGITVGNGVGLWEVTVGYSGSSAGFWHSVWYFDAADLSAGTFLFCKTVDCDGNPYPVAGSQGGQTFTWDASAELVLGLYVLPSGSGGGIGLPEGGYWLFTGASSRNPDNRSHYAWFDSQVYGDDDTTVLASRPAGTDAFIGFEDKCRDDEKDWVQDGTKRVEVKDYKKSKKGKKGKKKQKSIYKDVPTYKKVLTCSGGSDWDFNDAVLSLSWDQPSTPSETVPEPATMTLLATGLAGMAAARRRRRD